MQVLGQALFSMHQGTQQTEVGTDRLLKACKQLICEFR